MFVGHFNERGIAGERERLQRAGDSQRAKSRTYITGTFTNTFAKSDYGNNTPGLIYIK